MRAVATTVSDVPKTRHLGVGDGVHIALQRFGTGSTHLVFVPGFVSHIELQWADPAYARFLANLGRFATVTIYDKRGGGCSSGVDRAPTLEDHVRDLGRVIDSTQADKVVLLGFSNGGAIAMSYAAAHPERLLGLVLCSSFARVEGHEELVAKADEAMFGRLRDRWGEGAGIEFAAPSLAGSKLARRNYATFERAAMHPEMLLAVVEEIRTWDITPVLGLIEAPTLVLHRHGDVTVPIAASREVAARIGGARFVGLDGGDHVPYLGDSTVVLGEIEDFVREVAEDPAPALPQRTVLFTDLVGSTVRASAAGDSRWRQLREAHDDLTRSEVERHGGRAVKSTGDGWLAVFDEAPDAVRAASAVVQQVRRLDLEVRAGAHTGPVDELDDGDLVGLTVHVAARVVALAGPSQVLLTDAVRGRLATSASVEPRGVVDLKGVPGRWALHTVVGEVDELPPMHADPTLEPVLDGSTRVVVTLGRRMLAPARAWLAGARSA